MAKDQTMEVKHAYIFNYKDNDDGDSQLYDAGEGGDDWCRIEMLSRIIDHISTKVQKNYYADHTGFKMKKGTNKQKITFMGLVRSRTEYGYLASYIYRNHEISHMTDDDYLYIKYAVNDWHPFPSASGSIKNFTTGVFSDVQLIWQDTENDVYKVQIIFDVVHP